MKAIEDSSRYPKEPRSEGNVAQSELHIAVSYTNEISDKKNVPPAYSAKGMSKYTGIWNLKTSTPLGDIQEGIIRTCTPKAGFKNEGNPEYHQRAWRVYPSGLLRLLGVRHGAIIEASTSGWQYVIKPFNAVPENAPIFDFCRKGDLEGVRALLKLGHGSLRDRDPYGKTPLWVSNFVHSTISRLILGLSACTHSFFVPRGLRSESDELWNVFHARSKSLGLAMC